MIPQSLVTLIAFLLLVLPGLAFERGYKTVKPPRRSSAFQEASRVAATGLVFSAATIALLAWFEADHDGVLPDPAEWIRDGNAYVEQNYELVTRLTVIQVIASCAGAWLAAQSLRFLRPAHLAIQRWWAKKRPTFLPDRMGVHSDAPALWRVLEAGVGNIQVVALRTRDGSFMQGDLAFVDVEESFDTGTIAIAASGALVKKPWQTEPEAAGGPWSRIVVPLCEVTEIWTFTQARAAHPQELPAEE